MSGYRFSDVESEVSDSEDEVCSEDTSDVYSESASSMTNLAEEESCSTRSSRSGGDRGSEIDSETERPESKVGHFPPSSLTLKHNDSRIDNLPIEYCYGASSSQRLREDDEMYKGEDFSGSTDSVPDSSEILDYFALHGRSPTSLLLLVMLDGTLKCIEWPPSSLSGRLATSPASVMWSLATKVQTTRDPSRHQIVPTGEPVPLSSFILIDDSLEHDDEEQVSIESDDSHDSDSESASSSSSASLESSSQESFSMGVKNLSRFSLIPAFGDQLRGRHVFLKIDVDTNGSAFPMAAGNLSYVQGLLQHEPSKGFFDLTLAPNSSACSPTKLRVSLTNESANTFRLLSLGSGSVLAASERAAHRLETRRKNKSVRSIVEKALRPLQKKWLVEDAALGKDFSSSFAKQEDCADAPAKNTVGGLLAPKSSSRRKQALRAAMDALFQLELRRTDLISTGHIREEDSSWRLQTGTVELLPKETRREESNCSGVPKHMTGAGPSPVVFTSGLVGCCDFSDGLGDVANRVAVDLGEDVVGAYMVTCYIAESEGTEGTPGTKKTSKRGGRMLSKRMIPVTECVKIPVHTRPPECSASEPDFGSSSSKGRGYLVKASPTASYNSGVNNDGTKCVALWAYFNPKTKYLRVGDVVGESVPQRSTPAYPLHLSSEDIVREWKLDKIADISLAGTSCRQWIRVECCYSPKYPIMALATSPQKKSNISLQYGNVSGIKDFILQGSAGGLYGMPKPMSLDPSPLLDNHDVHGIIGMGAEGTVLLVQSRFGHMHAVKLVPLYALAQLPVSPTSSRSSLSTTPTTSPTSYLYPRFKTGEDTIATRRRVKNQFVPSHPALKEAFNHMPLLHRNLVRIHDCWIERSTDRLEGSIACLRRIGDQGLANGDGSFGSDSTSESDYSSRSDSTDMEPQREESEYSTRSFSGGGQLSSPQRAPLLYLMIKMEWCPRSLDSFLYKRTCLLQDLAIKAKDADDEDSCMSCPSPTKSRLGDGAEGEDDSATRQFTNDAVIPTQCIAHGRTARFCPPQMNAYQLFLFRKHQCRLQNLVIARQLFDGLSYIHDSGLVHLDIKPTNMFVVVDERHVLSAYRASNAAAIVSKALKIPRTTVSDDLHVTKAEAEGIGQTSGALVTANHFSATHLSDSRKVLSCTPTSFPPQPRTPITPVHADPMGNEVYPMLRSLASTAGSTGEDPGRGLSMPGLVHTVHAFSATSESGFSVDEASAKVSSPVSRVASTRLSASVSTANSLPSFETFSAPPFDPGFEHSYLLTKIGDFGISATSATHMPSQLHGHTCSMKIARGTYKYASPEQAEGRGECVTGASDVFSAGLVMLEMYGMESTALGQTRLLSQASKGDGAADSIRMSLWKDYPQEMQLISECLRKDPLLRPSASEARRRLKAIYREVSSAYLLDAGPMK